MRTWLKFVSFFNPHFMKRKYVMATLSIIFVVANVALLLFSYVQKIAADSAREIAVQNEMIYEEEAKRAKSEFDQCEGLRAPSDGAREECEQKTLAISNRK